MNQALQPIVLCADDYSHTAPISRAILDLAATGRISALSCMTASRHWPEHGPWLRAVAGKVDIGLHVTLVDEAPLTSMPRTAPDGKLPGIGALIVKSYLGQLALDEIDAEIRAQAAAFEKVMGFAPHHIDGHLHSHVLPGIRGLALKLADEMNPLPWVRNISDSLSAIAKRGVAVPKAAFLSVLGKGLRGAAHAPMNASFSGVYDFTPDAPAYAGLFEHFIERVTPRHLILCHPGVANDVAEHAALRAGEYAYLKSDAFLASLARRDLRLGRFAETLT